jgi:hypothetical protein
MDVSGMATIAETIFGRHQVTRLGGEPAKSGTTAGAFTVVEILPAKPLN